MVEVANNDYGKSQQEIKSIATNAVVKDKDLIDSENELSDGSWYYRFMKRQKQLFLQKGDQTANVRMDCLNREVMNNYF